MEVPIFIDDYKIHKHLIPKIKKLCKEDIGNILIYGPKGSGKFTLAKTMINTFYNKKIETTKKFITLDKKELVFYSSQYHFEIILNNNLNKKAFINLINYITENRDITNTFKLILIKNIEMIDDETIKILKFIVEKKVEDFKFILTTSNITKVDKFYLGFFLSLRLPNPNKKDLKQLLMKNYKLKKEKVEKIIDKNLPFSDLVLYSEILKKKKIYIDPITKNIKNIITLIKKKKVSNILKIREILYDLMSKNHDLVLIKKNILKFLLTDKDISYSKKKIIVSLFTEINGDYFKNIIPIEFLVVNIMNIL